MAQKKKTKRKRWVWRLILMPKSRVCWMELWGLWLNKAHIYSMMRFEANCPTTITYNISRRIIDANNYSKGKEMLKPWQKKNPRLAMAYLISLHQFIRLNFNNNTLDWSARTLAMALAGPAHGKEPLILNHTNNIFKTCFVIIKLCSYLIQCFACYCGNCRERVGVNNLTLNHVRDSRKCIFSCL